MNQPSTSDLGKLSRVPPLSDLARQSWDAIIIGAGHNGLTCANYLARAGKRVVVLESRERVGGAATLEEPFPGIRFSPCAYVIGLLHPLVLRELKLKERGFRWSPAESGMFIPFPDGSSLQLWNDDDRCAVEVKRFAPGDYEGWRALGRLKEQMRDALRPDDERDIWVGDSPTSAAIAERVAHLPFAREFLFQWSMVELMEHFFREERMQVAYLGQGVIGTHASPHDPGTAYIYFHHASGRMDGLPGTWGYVEGGMGRLSFLLADLALEQGVAIATGAQVVRIEPGRGVELATGEKLFAPAVISNADPAQAMAMVEGEVPSEWRRKVERIPRQGCTVKVNYALKSLPNYACRPGSPAPHHRGQINTPLSKREWHESHRLAKWGKLPTRVWTEQYFHTAYDPSVAPPGIHTMSVFAQYVPTEFAHGSWNDRREEVGDLVTRSIQDYVPDFPDTILHREVLGPPDIESRVGLSGGHIFQGECLPQYMWEHRPGARTPVEGLYLCGAGAHPGGSVMGINGRNAAQAVLEDLKV